MALQIEPSKKQPSMWPITRWFEKSCYVPAAKDPGLPAFPHHSTTNGLRPPNAAGSMHQEANCQQQPTAFTALQVLSKSLQKHMMLRVLSEGNQHQVKIQGMKLLNRKMALNTCTEAIKLGVYIWMDLAPITSMTCNKSWSSLDHSNSKHPKKNK